MAKITIADYVLLDYKVGSAHDDWGWAYDVYLFKGRIIVSGLRPIGEPLPEEKFNRFFDDVMLAWRQRANESWCAALINKYFVA